MRLLYLPFKRSLSDITAQGWMNSELRMKQAPHGDAAVVLLYLRQVWYLDGGGQVGWLCLELDVELGR